VLPYSPLCQRKEPSRLTRLLKFLGLRALSIQETKMLKLGQAGWKAETRE